MKLESVEKLRTAGRNMAKGRNLENHEECNLLLVIADEIQAEIAERYMELPVDADGVPIHVGDEVSGYGHPDGGPIVKFIGGGDAIMVGGHRDGIYNCLYWQAEDVRHIKPDPVKELLVEMLKNGAFQNEMAPWTLDEEINEYVAKIREAVSA